MRLMGKAEGRLGHSAKALSWYTRALDLAKTSKLPVQQSEALELIGWHLSRMGQRAEARARFEEALQIADAVGSQIEVLLDGGGMPALMHSGDWANDEWAVAQIYQRHLLQVRYVDRLVGDLVQRLKQEGLWDRALIVVTADHGVSFRAGSPFKEPDDKNVADIMSVPLFIKLPGQHGGSISDLNVQSIDVLPTIPHVISPTSAQSTSSSGTSSRTNRSPSGSGSDKVDQGFDER
jgi:membrane-anchored protein YejM (alkaline phosphatase superfamily)